jgi:ApaG protein
MYRATKSSKTLEDKFFDLGVNQKNIKLEKPYNFTTNDIEVTVWPEFVDNKLTAVGNLFIWAYQVRIENKSLEEVKLIKRYCKIIDSEGSIQEINSDGIIGEQPTIMPQDHYQYTSSVHLQNSSGIMMGHYKMQKIDGSFFNVKIPDFSLDIPNAKGVVN